MLMSRNNVFLFLTEIQLIFIIQVLQQILYSSWICSIYLYTYKTLIILIVWLIDCLFICLFEAVRTFEN